MIKLNLPEFVPKILHQDGKLVVFDIIRKKYIILTPEEWVRQHLVNYIINTLHYPKGLIKLEGGLSYNKKSKRTDIVVFDISGAPFIVVECKAPHIHIDKEVLFQASVYNRTLKAPFIAISNGLTHYFLEFQGNEMKEIDHLPPYSSLQKI